MNKCFVVILSLFIITGCNENPQTIKKQNTIKIGLLIDIKTPGGQPSINAAQLFVNKLNATSGILVNNKNHFIELLIKDTNNTPNDAMLAARTLIFNEQVIAIIGPNVSFTALSASAVAESAKVPLISPGSTAQAVTDNKSYIFQIAYNDKIQSQHLADFTYNKLKKNTAAIIYDVVNPASRTVAESFKTYFEGFGGSIQSSLSYVKSKGAVVNYETILASILEDKVPVVLLPNNSSDVIEQVDYLVSHGYQGVILGSDNWSPRKLMPLTNFDGTYFTHHWQASAVDGTNTLSNRFITDYKKAYELPPTSMSALTYDAFTVLSEAIRHSDLTTASIQESLLKITELPGVTRNITLNNKTVNMNQPIIFQIKNKTSHLTNYEE